MCVQVECLCDAIYDAESECEWRSVTALDLKAKCNVFSKASTLQALTDVNKESFAKSQIQLSELVCSSFHGH